MKLIVLIFSSFFIMLASLVGVFFTIKFLSDWTKKNIKYLLAFASGIFTIVSYNLVNEALELGTNTLFVWMAIICGFFIFLIAERFYPDIHCHHDNQKCLSKDLNNGARKILIGDAFHNIGDGVLLAPIFVANIKLGLMVAFGILIHEIVQEISEFFVLKNAGYSTKKALTLNFLTSSTILIGAIGGFYLSFLEYLIGPFIGFTAGIFIYILLADLVPKSIRYSRQEKKYFNYIVWIIFGILLILAVNLLAGN